MAFTRVGTGSAKFSWSSTSSPIVVTGLPASAAGSLIVVPFSTVQTGTTSVLTAVTSNVGGIWGWIEEVSATGTMRCGFAYCLSCPSGVTSVTLTFGTATATYGTAKIEEFSYSGTAAVDQINSAVGSSVPTPLNTGSITNTNSYGLMFAIAVSDDSSLDTWDALTNFTEIYVEGDTSVTIAGQAGYRIFSGSTGPYSESFQYNGETVPGCAIIGSFTEVASGPAATNTSDADQFILGSLGRYAKLGRGASGSRFVKQRPNDAGPVVWSDFFFDAAAAGHYTVNWESATYNITMAPVTLRRHLGMPVTPVSYAFSFQQVDLQVTRRLKVTPASYAFTFAPVTLRVHRKVAITPASYVFNFPNVSVTRSRILHVSPAAYTLTFSPVTLDVIRRVNVDPATYTFTLAPVTLIYTPVSGSYLLNVDPTSYSFNFPGASVLVSRKLPVAPTNYALTFSDVTMLASRKLSVAPAAFTLTFAPVTMIAHRKLPVIPATYVLSFSDAAATVGRKLVVTPATYTFTFADVTFVAPGAVFPPEAQVLLGVLYGPTGIEYTGEYADRIRYELSTGKFVKPIGDKLSLLL